MIDSSWKIWLAAALVSSIFHFGGASLLAPKSDLDQRPKNTSVKLKIIAKAPEPTPEPEIIAPKPVPPKPVEPKPKPKKVKKKKKKKIATIRKPPAKKPDKPQEAVLGLSKDSFAKDGKSGFAAPRGNTMMAEDEGKRLVEQPAALDVDLSSDAILISSSIRIPEYTDAALDANLEGYCFVDVFVDKEGNVVEAEMRKKMGYGMDKRILKAASEARFTPRKNRNGGAEESWTEIRFNLKIP